MIVATVRDGGWLQLGERAEHLGFKPGAAVQIIVSSSGSLILALDDSPPLEVPFRALEGGAAQAAARRAIGRGLG